MALWRVLDQNDFYRLGRRRRVTKGVGFDAPAGGRYPPALVPSLPLEGKVARSDG